MKVAVFRVNDKQEGCVELYAVDGEEWDKELADVFPQAEEEWWEMYQWLQENGVLVHAFKPDYSFTLVEV